GLYRGGAKRGLFQGKSLLPLKGGQRYVVLPPPDQAYKVFLPTGHPLGGHARYDNRPACFGVTFLGTGPVHIHNPLPPLAHNPAKGDIFSFSRFNAIC
ncbi:hypothetical protein, partial [Desulfobacter hydrogenophilus]